MVNSLMSCWFLFYQYKWRILVRHTAYNKMQIMFHGYCNNELWGLTEYFHISSYPRQTLVEMHCMAYRNAYKNFKQCIQRVMWSDMAVALMGNNTYLSNNSVWLTADSVDAFRFASFIGHGMSFSIQPTVYRYTRHELTKHEHGWFHLNKVK